MRTGKLYVAFFLTVFVSFCSGEDKEPPFTSHQVFSDDTVFVQIPVNNDNRDSLENIYGKFVDTLEQMLIDQGEFINASVSLTTPLFPKKWTSDFENLLAPAEERYLDSMLSAYEKQTSHEIAVVTLDSTWTTRENFDQFIIRLHNFWGVGKKSKDNGILIGVCRGYQMIRVSTGEGLRNKLTDTEVKDLVDKVMISAYVRNAFFDGTRNGIAAIMKELK